MFLCYETGTLALSYSNYLASISRTSTHINDETNFIVWSYKYYLLQHLLFKTTCDTTVVIAVHSEAF